MNGNEMSNDKSGDITRYFSVQEWGIILLLAVLAFLTSSFGLYSILPGGSAPGFVHAFLKLPGPGTGVFISSAFICLWLVAGLLLVKKTGTAITIAILITAITVAVGLVAKGAVQLDYLLVLVAIIIECAGLLPLESKPWQYLFPGITGALGVITLALWLTGNAKVGESGAAATAFPLGYVVTGIIAIVLAAICFTYPMKYLAGAGFAEMIYIVFCWLYTGKSGFASWVPVIPAIPPLLTFALVCGAVMALLAYCAYVLVMTYQGESPLVRRNW
jgi:hypothetical protein